MPISTDYTGRMPADAPNMEGHRFRYHLAAGFLQPGDVVVDAACGSGYGRTILGDVKRYIGVDQHRPAAEPWFIEADLQTWVCAESFDVFVGFETIEHLTDYSHYLEHAKRARRWMLFSVPVVPTTHVNPFHCHDFEPGQLASLVVDDDWELFQSVLQPSEYAEICVFARR